MPKTIVLDANLTVLLVFGNIDRTAIGTHRRLRAYEARDYDLLLRTLRGYAGLVCTPNILTEASNLLRQDGEPRRSRLGGNLRSLIETAVEIYVPSARAVSADLYPRLGLADAAIIEACGMGHSLLTADFQLYDYAARQGHDAINFNHLRSRAFGM